jgi:hypothetical protein
LIDSNENIPEKPLDFTLRLVHDQHYIK